jgi:hypothetical protein
MIRSALSVLNFELSRKYETICAACQAFAGVLFPTGATTRPRVRHTTRRDGTCPYEARPQQGLGQRQPHDAAGVIPPTAGRVERDDRLRGLLHEYYRAACSWWPRTAPAFLTNWRTTGRAPTASSRRSTNSPPRRQRRGVRRRRPSASPLIVHTLASFDVKSEVVSVSSGPAVNPYALQPAPGIQIRRVVSLENIVSLENTTPAQPSGDACGHVGIHTKASRQR